MAKIVVKSKSSVETVGSMAPGSYAIVTDKGFAGAFTDHVLLRTYDNMVVDLSNGSTWKTSTDDPFMRALVSILKPGTEIVITV